MAFKRWCLVYRTGGTVDFRWNRSVAFTDREEVDAAKAANERAGYKTLLVDYDKSLAIGLPDTYEA